jgi:hypothetical protein
VLGRSTLLPNQVLERTARPPHLKPRRGIGPEAQALLHFARSQQTLSFHAHSHGPPKHSQSHVPNENNDINSFCCYHCKNLTRLCMYPHALSVSLCLSLCLSLFVLPCLIFFSFFNSLVFFKHFIHHHSSNVFILLRRVSVSVYESIQLDN